VWPTLAELGGLPPAASSDELAATQVWPTLDELGATGDMASPGDSPPTQRLAPVDTRRLEVLEAYDGLALRTHFQVLGVPRDATEAQVREAYFRLAKRFHPDVHHDAALSELRDKLEEVFTRLGEAYEVLCSPRIRASYERELARQEGAPAGSTVTADPARETEAAAEAIERGSESLAQERYWEAIRLFESAIPWAEGALKQQARILLARAYAKNPGWVKQGEELLLAVLREEPDNLNALLQLGRIYKVQGLRSRALSTLRRVLELSPAHEEARHLIGDLGP
jgi:tetratricopeptide (TPR) repeat protein